MSEPRLISPMLDNFIMGGPISDHNGICCCPAMENDTNNRYIVKIISVPASATQIDALLLSGAYADEEAALAYFKELADGVVQEVKILESLSELEGFIPYAGCQVEQMTSGKGYEIYLLSEYKRTLFKHFKRHSFTHLDALNLGLDLCAALSVCRRSGYLYVDLKPSNVFVTDQRLFRIGDLGFIRLDSLKYASLPDKYHSQYTPPEVRDAFSALNTTMDVYAAGLILYQTYNNGELPFRDDLQPGDKLPAPLYADYEMSEIILKACDPNPEERWQDPMQMGQAIVSYMQRNGAADTPIVPMPTQEEASENTDIAPVAESEEIQQAESLEDVSAEEVFEATEEIAEEAEEADEFTEEDEEVDLDAVDYDTITDEVSEMLNQADELASLDVPEPVVVPDHVDIPMPEPIEPEVTEDTEEDTEAEEAEAEIQEEQEDEVVPAPAKTKHRWLRNIILAILLIDLLLGGYLFYKNYYILPIDSISVEGNEDTLTVFVSTDIDESLLQVICSDTYGNKIPAPVINGKAEFSNLVSNTAYSIKVVANGFHRLTGKATTAYSTPIQTNIVQFDAVTGTSEDSVILSFTVEGPECEEWTVEYAAEGESTRTATFSSHMVTLTGLAVGKEYTFQLVPSEDLYVTGQDQITFTTRPLIRAENLQITSCVDNSLTAKWATPEGETVSSWSIRCYNETYSQTIITAETTATFQGLDHTKAYHVEVKAVGMSVGEIANISANSATATNFRVDTSDPTKFAFAWDGVQGGSAEDLVLYYSVEGLDEENSLKCDGNTAEISPVIPNATYHIRMENVDKLVLLGSKMELKSGAAADFNQEFDGFTASRAELQFSMVSRPPYKNWDRYDLLNKDYTSTFSANEDASFLVYFSKKYAATTEGVSILYVIRNQDGALVQSDVVNSRWRDMWYQNYCELDIPAMPTQAGTYTIDVYFNGGLAHSQEFTIQ